MGKISFNYKFYNNILENIEGKQNYLIELEKCTGVRISLTKLNRIIKCLSEPSATQVGALSLYHNHDMSRFLNIKEQ